MPKDVFGSPNIGDAVARDEQTVQEAAQYGVDLDNVVKEMSPRSLGSVKVSPEDRAAEYEQMRDTPEHLAQFFQDQNATVEQMIQYAKNMENKRGTG